MTAPLAPAAPQPCPFCGEPLALREHVAGRHWTCPACERKVCYHSVAGRLVPVACNQRAPLKIGDDCPKCGVPVVDGCPNGHRAALWAFGHRYCAACRRCWTVSGADARCKPGRKKCHHCDGSGHEPEEPKQKSPFAWQKPPRKRTVLS